MSQQKITAIPRKILTIMASSQSLCCVFLLSVLLHSALGAVDDPTLDIGMWSCACVYTFLSAVDVFSGSDLQSF